MEEPAKREETETGDPAVEDNEMENDIDELLSKEKRSCLRGNSILFEHETAQIKKEMDRQKSIELAEKKEQRVSMRMTGPSNRKKARLGFENKRFSMEYGEDATPLSHRISTSNPKRNKTMYRKQEGQKYASPFTAHEHAGSVSMVAGFNKVDDTLAQSAPAAYEGESPASLP